MIFYPFPNRFFRISRRRLTACVFASLREQRIPFPSVVLFRRVPVAQMRPFFPVRYAFIRRETAVQAAVRLHFAHILHLHRTRAASLISPSPYPVASHGKNFQKSLFPEGKLRNRLSCCLWGANLRALTNDHPFRPARLLLSRRSTPSAAWRPEPSCARAAPRRRSWRKPHSSLQNRRCPSDRHSP